MKILYEFKINKEKEIEDVVISKNENQEEVKTTKKTKTHVPIKVVLKKPTRVLFDEAELFYGVKLSEGIKAGLLTRALLAKRFNNDGGVLSEIEQLEYSQLYVKLFQLQTDFQRLSIKEPKERTPEEEVRYIEIIKSINTAREKIQSFEISQASLFDQTAENRSRNKTIIWWLLQLSYIENDKSELEPLFGDGEYLEKLYKYDSLEEDGSDFDKKLIQKLVYLISFWYMGRASSREEFDKLLNILETENSEILENAENKKE